MENKDLNDTTKEESKEYYDKVYTDGPIANAYQQSPEEIVGGKYFFSWKLCADFIEKNNIKLVVDIGCGPGHFPEVIKKYNKNYNVKYIGIDFSKVAINISKKKFLNDQNYDFIVSDALEIDYNDLVKNYDIKDVLFTSFEFMEHISFDLQLLNILPSNYKFCWSVPSYPFRGHVRWFKTVKEIKDRYDKLIDFNSPIVLSPFKAYTYYICSTIK